MVEKLVRKQTVCTYFYFPFFFLDVEAPPGGREKIFTDRFYVEKTGAGATRCKSLEAFQHSFDRDDYWKGRDFWEWYGNSWKFRPVQETNLWLAITDYGWWKKKHIEMLLFNTEKILRRKTLTTSYPEGLSLDLRFDPVNHLLTYRTDSEQAAYNVLEDTIVPSGNLRK